jgi:hypothetical protein
MLDILIAVVLAFAFGGLLFGILPVWQRAVRGGHRLPIWAFLRRQGAEAALQGRAALQAQVLCATCSDQDRCAQRLAAGEDKPPAGCPNLSRHG